MVCIACFVSMVFIVTVRHMRRYTLFYSIVLMLFIIFCAGFGWNWLRMIKEEEAKIASTYALHLNQLPIHCRPHDMTWLDRIWYYSYEKDCEKYFKEISIDPVVRISPTLVLSETITMMFLHPFGKIGTAFGEFLAALIDPIPFAHKWYLVPLVLVLIFVTFFLSYLVLIGGVISFKSLLGSVEIGRRESRNAGGLPRLDSFRPARQMIENVPREEVGGGGLRRIEGERVREEEGVERGRGDSGGRGRGGEREENWRGGGGEGGRGGGGGGGERRLRLEEGKEREWNEGGGGGGGGRGREREENCVGGGEERRLKVQEGSERDENRRGRGGEGRLRRIDGEREMEEDNGGRRFGLQEVREREGNEGGGDNPRERGKTEENVGEKRDEGWLSEIRRRIGWGGRSGENEGEERRRIERGGSDWNEREGGRKVETQEREVESRGEERRWIERGGSEWNEREGGRKVETQEREVESSGGRRRRIEEEKDGGRRVERERVGGRVLDEGGSGDSPKGRERVGDRWRGGGEGWNEEENRQGDGGTCDKCGGEGRIMRREEEEGETVKNVGEKVGRGECVEEEGGQKGGGKNCEVERRLEERGEDLGEVRCVENQAENSKSVEKIRDKVGGNLKKPMKGENEESGSSAKKNVGEGEREIEEEEEEFNMHFSPKAYKELKTIYKRFKTIVTSNDQDDDDDDDDSENDAPDISGFEKLKKRTKS
ncbi:ABC transporter F family member 4 [Nilaparvata lugens]|uniref:ABC transporter F family member 4 n=1 Tax=Nilaparvata lugens TaxID=108931 RepID=UPI00193D3279|nr:ABC transporter F family member 4 [Nilaparvata lugens]